VQHPSNIQQELFSPPFYHIPFSSFLFVHPVVIPPSVLILIFIKMRTVNAFLRKYKDKYWLCYIPCYFSVLPNTIIYAWTCAQGSMYESMSLHH